MYDFSMYFYMYVYTNFTKILIFVVFYNSRLNYNLYSSVWNPKTQRVKIVYIIFDTIKRCQNKKTCFNLLMKVINY